MVDAPRVGWVVIVPETMSDNGMAVGLIDASEKETVGGGVPAGADTDEGGTEPAAGLLAAAAELEGAALFWRARLACRASKSAPCADARATGIATAESKASLMAILRKGLGG